MSVAAFALLLLAAPLALVTIALLLVQGRPAFFVQTRSGRYGTPFGVLKFRTMRDTCDPSGRLLPDDERTTRLGAALRRLRIDEMPQLWNVLVGDMSLIGPRPLLPVSIREAGSKGLRRGTVRPGLTGWAQVNGNRRLTDADKMRLDLWYIANRSIGLDLAILGRTIGVILFGERIDADAIGRAYAGCPDRRG